VNPPVRVIVRMYRELLGDCFLIRMQNAAGSWTHILIDCGILQGIPGAAQRMIAIAEDIEKTTSGALDLVVVTHEHHDHISGFAHAKDILLDPKRIESRELWMAWTEDPADTDAERLRQDLSSRKFALARLALALDSRGRVDQLDALTEDLHKFIGPIEGPSVGLNAAPQGRLTGAQTMAELKNVASVTRFLSPGMVLEIPGETSVPVAVLAPPRATARLSKDLPSKGEQKETYLEEFLEFSLLGADGPDGTPQLDMCSPFSARFSEGLRTPADEKEIKRWGREKETSRRWIFDHYYAPNDTTDRPQAFRRIDNDWTNSASSLALKLDSDTNNTSLVLAFRLPDRSFLLFAADAQVGNWLSWHDQGYDFGNEELSAADILARTRLYKVGHHGSHNATLRTKGVEMMNHPELTAMISTVEEIAHEQGKPPGWQMPDEHVRHALLERCRGRVLRGDRQWTNDADVGPYRRGQRKFAARINDSSPLFVELTVFDDSKPAQTKKG
jgi:hypothetical protein